MATSIYSAQFGSPYSQVHQDSLRPNPTLPSNTHIQETSRSSIVSRRILLVDDDGDIRSLVRAFLESEGFEVFCCGDAHRASHLFRTRNEIDLLLTDMQMPEVSGLTLANQLTAMRPFLPVVLMSGAIQTIATERWIANNGWRFLAKPFQVPKLLDTVHELLASNSLSA